MRVLAVCHEFEEDLGTLHPLLKDKGVVPEFAVAPDHKIQAIDPLEHDVVIVMGGPMGAYETEKYPYLQYEINFLKERIAGDKPTLGICLGAQLMAVALGAKGYLGQQGPEIGWKDLILHDAAREHPVRHFDSKFTKMMQAHRDTFDFPEQTTLLISSEKYENQAFQVGQNCLGLQFHPEVRTDIIAQWTRDDGKEFFHQDGMTPAKLKAETEKYADTLKKQTALFFNEWLDSVTYA